MWQLNSCALCNIRKFRLTLLLLSRRRVVSSLELLQKWKACVTHSLLYSQVYKYQLRALKSVFYLSISRCCEFSLSLYIFCALVEFSCEITGDSWWCAISSKSAFECLVLPPPLTPPSTSDPHNRKTQE